MTQILINKIATLIRRTIFAKMIASLAIVGTVPLSVFGFFAIKNHAAHLLEQNRSIHRSLLESVKSNFESQINRARLALLGASTHEVMRATNLFLIRETIANLRMQTPEIARLIYLDNESSVITSDPPSPNEDGKSFEVALNQIAYDLPASLVVGSDTSTERFMYLATPIFGLSGEKVGMLVAKIDLSEWYASSQRILVDHPNVSGGLLQYGNDQFAIRFGQNTIQYPAQFLRAPSQRLQDNANDSDHHFQTKVGNTEYFASVGQLAKMNGAIIIAQPTATLFAATQKLIWSYVAFLIVLLATTVVVILKVARGIAEPLEEISSVAASYKKGDFKRRLAWTRDDEIGALADAFNSMGAALEEKTKIGAEIALAENVQKGLTRKPLPKHSKLKVETYYKPALRLGGDWYAVMEIEKLNSTFVMIGDVTGHGLAQGLIVGAVQGALAAIETLMNATDHPIDLKPSEIMAVLDEVIRSTTEENSLLMTAIIAKFDFNRNEIVVSNAGHPFPALIRQVADANQIQNILASPQGIVGHTDEHHGKSKFIDSRFALNDLDLIVFYTDGLTNARDLNGRGFGRSMFRDFRNIRSYISPTKLKDRLAKSLSDHITGVEQDDDICFLIVEFRLEDGAILARSS